MDFGTDHILKANVMTFALVLQYLPTVFILGYAIQQNVMERRLESYLQYLV